MQGSSIALATWFLAATTLAGHLGLFDTIQVSDELVNAKAELAEVNGQVYALRYQLIAEREHSADLEQDLTSGEKERSGLRMANHVQQVVSQYFKDELDECKSHGKAY